MTERLPSVSVVIPNHDRSDHLDRTLRHLCNQDYPDIVQVIVSDDGSADDSTTVARSHGVELVVSPTQQGPGAARNAGLRHVRGDIVLFLDADMLAPSGVVREHVACHLRTDDLVVLGARRHLPAGTTTICADVGRRDSREALQEHFSHNLGRTSLPWLVAYTCNMSVPCALLQALGTGPVFDEGLVGWGLEDVELAYRLDRLGSRWEFAPAAVAYHQYHDRAMTAERFAGWSRNLDAVIARHPELDLLKQLIPVFDPAGEGDYITTFLALELEWGQRRAAERTGG